MTRLSVSFRPAVFDDIQVIADLLADDEFGRRREAPCEIEKYRQAFKDIRRDPNNEIIVGVVKGEVAAVLQLTYTRTLTLRGLKRVTIEGVRVCSRMRGAGIGKRLFDFALSRARLRGCGLAQLTTNKKRRDAQRFYERLGFKATHQGMKLHL